MRHRVRASPPFQVAEQIFIAKRANDDGQTNHSRTLPTSHDSTPPSTVCSVNGQVGVAILSEDLARPLVSDNEKYYKQNKQNYVKNSFVCFSRSAFSQR